MKTIRQKLQNQKGASITFALLLFLVCAVISSVVIVAGTTAAGRMKNMAEMDQRYYSVASAAGIIQEMFDGKKVEVVRKTTTTKTTKYTVTTTEEETTTVVDKVDNGEPTITVTIKEKNGTSSTEPTTLLSSLIGELVNTTTTGTWRKISEPVEKNLGLTGRIGDEEVENLKCTIKLTMATDGSLTVVVSNDNPKENYKLSLWFGADIKQNTDTNTKTGTPDTEGYDNTDDSVVQYSVTDTITESVTTTVTWKLNGIQKVRAGAAVTSPVGDELSGG